MDWGLSGVIVGFIAFISNMFTDSRVKRLNNQITALEQRLSKFESVLDVTSESEISND